MLKPFQLVWELIEFGLQALFLYVLVLILMITVMFFALSDSSLGREKEKLAYVTKVHLPKVGTAIEKVCTRIDGCRILKDGTIEW
jgi:hypothetical protein